MDFHQRLKSFGTSKYQSYINAFSKWGNPQEIISYIAEMPICCAEDRGIFHVNAEVRIDHRFLVICYRKEITVYPTNSIQTFYVSACENFTYYHFGINNQTEFCVNCQSAHALYLQLVALYPDFFRSIPYAAPMRIYENVYLHINSQEVIIENIKLFGKTKKTTIPLDSILTCYQLFDSDSESTNAYLNLCTNDGTVHKIRTYDDIKSFKAAQTLKTMLPKLNYIFPQA